MTTIAQRVVARFHREGGFSSALIEPKLLAALERWVNGQFALSPTMVALLKHHLESRDIPEIFHEPDYPELYRGVSLTDAMLKKLGGDWKAGKGELDVSLTFGKEGRAASWTPSKNSAWGYATQYGGHDNSVVLCASLSANHGTFVSGPNGFYRIYELSRFSRMDKEVIAVKPVKVHKIMWKSVL